MIDFEMLLRLVLSLVFAGLIGYEREMSQSNAGIKTHILVGVGSTVIALIQLEVTQMAINLFYQGVSGVSSDPTRLIAQIVSGIGFLGAGTIIVTKRNVSGLTTAATIWTVAGIGIALGMGFYQLAIMGFLLIVSTLFLFKRVIKIRGPESFVVKQIFEVSKHSSVEEAFKSLGIEVELVRFNSEALGNELLHTHVFRIISPRNVDFSTVIETLSKVPNIVSVEKSNIEG